MAVKTIYEKTIGSIIYELKYFEGDKKYVIYKWDKELGSGNIARRIPMVEAFDDKQKAIDYLDGLDRVDL